MERTIVVGDVHGCREELEALLRACAWTRGERLILAGDLVAKGPDSQGVVQLARESGALAVRGNHDEHVLRGRATLAPDVKPPRPEHRQVIETLTPPDWLYLESLPLLLRLGAEGPGQPEAVVLHGGAVPGVPLDQQDPANLINMRSMTAAGAPSRRIEGLPWAAVWRGPERIIFGHDAIRGLQQYPWALGLDTGCVYGNRLTAVILPERRLVSVPARRSYVGPDVR